MYKTNELLKKLNASNKLKNANAYSISDIMFKSLAELRMLCAGVLTWDETVSLYQQAQKQRKENKLEESRILSRANPQLAKSVRLGIRSSATQRSYENLFPARASSFSKAGSVASMFSPAGYLTELYREAAALHETDSEYNLNKRRPDLGSLSLSQNNMDEEVTTLSLSSEILLNIIQPETSQDYSGVMEMLSTYRLTGNTPYHQSYENCRNAILLQDPGFNAFRTNPDVVANMDKSSLLGIEANISPELRKILIEEITEDKIDDTLKENFGVTDVTKFQDIRYLARWYGLSINELSSILGIMYLPENISPSIQYYQNNQLVILREDDGVLTSHYITMTDVDTSHGLKYAELLPLGNNNFQLNYCYSEVPGNTVGLELALYINGSLSSTITTHSEFIPQKNSAYSETFKLSNDQLSQAMTFVLFTIADNNQKPSSQRTFNYLPYPFNIFLLKLNKLIRLYDATGISSGGIRAIIDSNNSDVAITDDVLSNLFYINYYKNIYKISLTDAMILSGSFIPQSSWNNEVSVFDQIFNTPLVDNKYFPVDGTAVTLTPGSISDTFRSVVMKRALGVNDTELYTLWCLTSGNDAPGDFTCTIANLSVLYRMKLLADVNGLNVTELAALLSVLPDVSGALGSLSLTKLNSLVNTLDKYTRWLHSMNWTVSSLYLMLTNQFSTALTPDIANLITTLKSSITSQLAGNSEEAVFIKFIAPVIAAAAQLDSAEMATAILQWLSQLKPQNLTVIDFMTLVINDYRTEDETIKLVSYCQVMGQLVLIARNTAVSASEMTWVVSHPALLVADATVLNQDISMLLGISELHDVLGRCGTHASEILTSLSGSATSEKDNLPVKALASALSLDAAALAEALAQCSSVAYFYNWDGIRGALQWMNVASTLGITPAGVAQLVSLDYASSYADWTTASHNLQSGLNTQQTSQLSHALDESLSDALSAYVVANDAPEWVTNRDQLYSWLLIDNQVSVQVKTTRIAEAIASIQLYISRALSGLETGVVDSVRSKAFFTSDWDTCNKRYSTWAGVSELVYYPENYVDPTIRIGQTKMMAEMLQSLSQSQLTSDTVEDGFKTYMTRFEEIANLDVLSGYHDDITDQEGKTCIIGRSDIGDHYWRTADIGKLSGGKLPANAWSEWKKITLSVTPVNNLVRPVIFQSRLYLVWIGSQEISVTDESGSGKATEYQLNFSHILHDGTWSSPSITPLKNGLKLDSTSGMYCASKSTQDQLYIILYTKSAEYTEAPTSITGLRVLMDNSREEIDPTDCTRVLTRICNQLDTTASTRLYTPYVDGQFVVDSVNTIEAVSRPHIYSGVDNSDLINCIVDPDSMILSFDVHIKSVHESDDKILHTDSQDSECVALISADLYRGKYETDLSAHGHYVTITGNNGINVITPVDVCDVLYYSPVTCIEIGGCKASIADVDFIKNKFSFDIVVNSFADQEKEAPKISVLFNIALITSDDVPVITLNRTDTFAQYLEYGVHRIRVNTLFARQLISRASSGLDTILSMATQELQEPKPGEGNYVEVTFSKYTEDEHGEGWFNLYLVGTTNDIDGSRSRYLYTKGNVSKTDETKLTIFVPYDPNKTGNESQSVYIGVQYSDEDFTGSFSTMESYSYDPITGDYTAVEHCSRGMTSKAVNSSTEPMDFNGANALYFWEMFYYVPMMVFSRLLSENRFTEATRWIKYIWSPDGYLVNGQPATYQWNVRPLQEETSWQANALDSVDPDAVAQADPMHYKVATFMAYLDLLIARGDSSYRQLERDTLSEAKMWYAQALDILGNEPYLDGTIDWINPRLDAAASSITQTHQQEALMAVRQNTHLDTSRTANALLALFLPQQNEKLTSYWQTLSQRLYNLRHNLSIDGNPLSLPIYASIASPAALLSAAVNSASGIDALPTVELPMYRFPVMLENARSLVTQLSQFGSSLLAISERQDAEALSELMQTQGSSLILQSIAMQDTAIREMDADIAALEALRNGAQSRLDSYTTLYNEDVSTAETQVMDLTLAASVLSTTATVSYTVAAALDAVPNIYGVAFGGSRYGAPVRAIATGIEIGAQASRAAAERINISEGYRRRRQEWEIQRNAAEAEVRQIDARLNALSVRREGAVLQKSYLETRQAQAQTQMTFLQNKFTSKALYNWLRGKVAAIYYQFYDLTVSRCLMAQRSYQYALNDDSASFISTGAWQGTYAGLMAGETLMLNLAQMEQSWLKEDNRKKEVTRTVCLSEVYAALSPGAFSLADGVVTLVSAGKGAVGTSDNGLTISDGQLQATLKLDGLNIKDDYPLSTDLARRIKQISVTLPALVGPYQDVRAILSYGGSTYVPQGCESIALSHGMNDSGQFQLDFNDSRWLPFEGIPVNDPGTLTLSFPDADSNQKDLLLSLTDIILHLRYTIAS